MDKALAWSEMSLRKSAYVACIVIMCVATIVMYGLSELSRMISKGVIRGSDHLCAAAAHCKSYMDDLAKEYQKGTE